MGGSPTQGPTPDAKLAARGCQIDLHRRFVKASPTSRESCIVLQSRPTRSLVAKFSQHSVYACSIQMLCCRGRTLQMRPRTGVCKPLMPDVIASKEHQNHHSYVSSVDLPSDSLSKILTWWVVTRKMSKLSKLGGGRLLGKYGTYLAYIFHVPVL